MDISKFSESDMKNYNDGFETGYMESKFYSENMSECDSDTPWSIGFDDGFSAYKQEKLDAIETVKRVMRACADGHFKFLCEFNPEGIEYKSYKYKEESDFFSHNGENRNEEFARYIYPARDEMKSVCLHKAIELMNDYL